MKKLFKRCFCENFGGTQKKNLKETEELRTLKQVEQKPLCTDNKH